MNTVIIAAIITAVATIVAVLLEHYLETRKATSVNLSASVKSNFAAVYGKVKNHPITWIAPVILVIGGIILKYSYRPRTIQLTTSIGDNVQPTFSPDGQEIVFISERDGNAEIYLMDFDGSNQRRLTSTPAYEDVPSFSPDGSKIIFARNVRDNEELFVMNRDGSSETNISNAPDSNEGRPRFASGRFTSERVVFDSDRSGDWEIYIGEFIAGTLTNVRQVTHRPKYSDRLPSFHEPSQRILFRSESLAGGPSQIHMIDTDGSNLTSLSDQYSDWYPAVTNHSNWIVFVSARSGSSNIFGLNLSNRNVVQLTNTPARVDTPAVSSDNSWMVYASREEGDSFEVFKTNLYNTLQ